MEARQRCSKLETSANPGARLDYVVTLAGRVAMTDRPDPLAVMLRYVPDRLILEPSSLDEYLRSFETWTWNSFEAIAVAILEDMSNEVVARWTQISLRVPDRSMTRIGQHDIIVEERQPNWDNAELLSRLPKV